jgi:NADH-quinone oxidoreductase subunit M
MMVIALGSMVGAAYIIWTFRRVIYGEMSDAVKNGDFTMNRVEFSALVIFAVLIVLFGIYPSAIFDTVNLSFTSLASTGGI